MKMYRYLKPATIAATLAIALPAAAQTGFRYDDYATSGDTRLTTKKTAMTGRMP